MKGNKDQKFIILKKTRQRKMQLETDKNNKVKKSRNAKSSEWHRHAKCVLILDSWGGLNCESQSATLIPLSCDGPSFEALRVCVPSLRPFTYTHCAQCYLSDHLCLALQVHAPVGGRTESRQRDSLKSFERSVEMWKDRIRLKKELATLGEELPPVELLVGEELPPVELFQSRLHWLN